MKKTIAKILSNEEVSDGFFRMRIASGYLARTAKPGQFVEVRCSGGAEPLLRRPLGVHRITASGIEMLYQVVGKGTAILSGKGRGEEIDILGPLGNGFDLETSGSAVLVAGGIGVAPLVALAEKTVNRLSSIVYRKKITVLTGARTRSHILCEKDFRSLGCDVKVATEDGTKGCKGLVTDLLKDFLQDSKRKTKDERRTTIYACGPVAMLKAVSAIARSHGIRCQVSLEERMACGVGVCLGCPVKVRPHGAYKMVCKDGPVFDAAEVMW